ncbi:MAG: cell division protein FtsZ [Deltaproteobacteria bacterium]|nr:cell division protein FtsZ [Deltaproteobacteria bacterium]MBW2050682.1 cell division protein FtsZ [Deltaproteobacteria bacterium]MBW2139600.1 cell division protein FtsZ [Deltaproteobacteria bacterium]MBW2323284.1 cell division protein FtsZ [Deltaproteobacteria bacterium]
MDFQFVENQQAARIKVIGVGGAGNNAINNMISSGLAGVGFIAANTDLQALESSSAPTKLQLGQALTKGLGCGANPDVGRDAALEDIEKIRELLSDSDMVFITAGMGGGTGTGGAPVIAEVLKNMDPSPLTVAVVTKPFHFEGKRRLRQAEDGIKRLKEYADTIISIPNNRLIAMAPRGCGLKEAFKMADDVLLQAVRGVSDLILVPGLINLDFADAQTVMAAKGMALMGTGIASGPDRATVAAEKAISSPLLDDISVKGAQGLLINIASAENNIALEEVDEACSCIQEEAHEEATIIFGVAWDNTLGDDIRITVIATGIGSPKEEPLHLSLEDAKPEITHVPTLEDVHKDRRGEYDRPTGERLAKGIISAIRRPRYTNYDDVFPDAEEDLERPTFMRRQAD